MNKNERQMIGLQHSSYEEITTYLKKKLIDHFQNKIGTTFSIFNQTNVPYTMFNMQLTMYKYFNVILNYDRGSFGCSIINGDTGISLDNSQKWYDTADMNVFLQELKQQIELRIPDKFLEFHGWK